MEVNTLDQLIRPEPKAGASARHANDSGSNPFSSLLEARAERSQSERPRSERPPVERQRVERARVEQNDPNAQSANGASIKARKNASDDAPEKPTHAEANERPSAKDTAERGNKAHAADKAERPAASEPKIQVADDVTAKATVAQPDAENAAIAVDDDASAAADAQAAAIDAADPLAVVAAVAVDLNLGESDLRVSVEKTMQTAETLQPVAAAIAAPLATQAVAEPKTAAAAPAAAVQAPAAPVADDAKKLEAAAAAPEIAKPTSSLSAQQAAVDANDGEDYADFMLRSLAATPAVAATEKDADKAEAKAKETAWTVAIAPSAMATAPVAPTTALAVQAAADIEAAIAIDADAPKIQNVAAADESDAKPAAKTAEGTAQFAQHLDPSRDVRAAEEARAPARPTAPPAHEQVAVHVRKAVAEGLDQITIRLNPAELGRIEVKIEIGSDGSLRAAFAADKQMTLDLLKGDSRQLEQALSEAGLKTDAGGLNFSLRGDNRENAQAFRQLGEEFARNRAEDPAANEAPAPLAAGSYARRNAGPGRIDLNA
jgi:hypothetical protein